MNVALVTGIMLILVPLGFNAAFAALATTFDYPDVLRRPTHEVLELFLAGGSRLVLLWWAFAITAVAVAPMAVLLAVALADADPSVVWLMAATGVLAALVQFLGLIRWPFLVPFLARASADPNASPARREAVDIVFQAFNRYLGVAVGEHLGYLFTGAWSVLVGVAAIQGTVLPAWLGVVGIVVGAVLALCSLEFVGPFEPNGWRLAGAVIPVAYIVWSAWLIGIGIALLL